MDARSLFAVLAVVFLLWLIRTWVKWDSRERTALASRQRIKNRLADPSLAQRVKSDNLSPSSSMAIPTGEPVETEDDAVNNSGNAEINSEKAYADESISAVSASEMPNTEVDDTIERLRQQLKLAEEKALAARQNDLELRRLRSEFQSVVAERENAIKRLNELEKRVSEQQSALNHAGQDKSLVADVEKLKLDLADREKQNEQLRKQLSRMLGSVESDSLQSEIDLTGKLNDDLLVDGRATATSSDEQALHEQESAASAAGKVPVSKAPRAPLYEAPLEKDDLKLIKGIGPVMERTLNELGVTTFKQLASFEQQDIDMVSEAIGAFPGRIERDDWVGKAQEFLRRQSPA